MSQPLERPLSEVLFITELRDWARAKGNEEYDYNEPRACACSQFLRETGRAIDPSVSPPGWHDRAKGEDCFFDKKPLPAGLEGQDGLGVLSQTPWTFSALAQRLDALLPASVERVRG